MTLEKVLNIIVDAYELSKGHFLGPENRIYYSGYEGCFA